MDPSWTFKSCSPSKPINCMVQWRIQVGCWLAFSAISCLPCLGSHPRKHTWDCPSMVFTKLALSIQTNLQRTASMKTSSSSSSSWWDLSKAFRPVAPEPAHLPQQQVMLQNLFRLQAYFKIVLALWPYKNPQVNIPQVSLSGGFLGITNSSSSWCSKQ